MRLSFHHISIFLLLGVIAGCTSTRTPTQRSLQDYPSASPPQSMHAVYFVDESIDEPQSLYYEDHAQLVNVYAQGTIPFSTYRVPITALPPLLESRFVRYEVNFETNEETTVDASRERVRITPGSLVLIGKDGSILRTLSSPFFEDEIRSFYFPDETEKQLYDYE